MQRPTLQQLGDFFRAKGIFIILHIIILLLSILLIALISIDTFNGIDFYDSHRFEKVQFWICIVFLADFFIELFLAPKKWHYIWTHLIFFIVSIPYQALILHHYDFHISQELAYLIRYMPLIRGGYAMAIVVGWFTSNKATGLFFTYIITLISTVYFASLTFYLFEYGVNPLVKHYQDALWWAAMDVTTVGSNIVAVTTVGRVLSVLLAALGMMMFPIFTVYVTNLLTKRNKDAIYQASIIDAYRQYMHNHPDIANAPANAAVVTIDHADASAIRQAEKDSESESDSGSDTAPQPQSQAPTDENPTK